MSERVPISNRFLAYSMPYWAPYDGHGPGLSPCFYSGILVADWGLCLWLTLITGVKPFGAYLFVWCTCASHCWHMLRSSQPLDCLILLSAVFHIEKPMERIPQENGECKNHSLLNMLFSLILYSRMVLLNPCLIVGLNTF